jgi:hypothetical protein
MGNRRRERSYRALWIRQMLAGGRGGVFIISPGRIRALAMDPNRKGILVGGVITATATSLLFLLPTFVSIEEFKLLVYRSTGEWMFGDPFAQLRLLGGIPGGLVAGYLARDHFGNVKRGNSMKISIYATLSGLLLLLVAFALFNIYSAIVIRGIFPPPIYLIVVVPLIVTAPLFPAYLIEGLVFGYAASIVQETRAG